MLNNNIYKISLNRYSYKLKAFQSIDEIMVDLIAVGKEAEMEKRGSLV